MSSNKWAKCASVVNAGITGSQVLQDGAGLSALAHFDCDVLSIAGVGWVILLEGINDISIRGRADNPEALIGEIRLQAVVKLSSGRIHMESGSLGQPLRLRRVFQQCRNGVNT